MTETICPTCGARCKKVNCDVKDCNDPAHIKALPPPDLTKLREAYEPYKSDKNNDHHVHTNWCGCITEREDARLLQAVYELLEDNKL